MTTTLTIHHKQIIRISQEGLLFASGSTEPSFVDFTICNTNWRDYHNVPANTTQESKGIAWRDATDTPPWIEFFSQPRLRIIFPSKYAFLPRIFPKITRGNLSAFRDAVHTITAIGWTTYDLS